MDFKTFRPLFFIKPGAMSKADIRRADAVDFPLQARFVAMKQDGQLSQATDAGARLAAYVLSDAFANDPTPDLRQLSV